MLETSTGSWRYRCVNHKPVPIKGRERKDPKSRKGDKDKNDWDDSGKKERAITQQRTNKEQKQSM
jgi:hypothetical protein